MREVSLYVNNVKLDLFKDEEIQVSSTIQNLQDISKVFTDFTQTFTLPCSKVNNEVFEYYFNSDIDASFSAQNRQPARLEINNVPFRNGKIQLESGETKRLKGDNYKVTFYGEITTLKDLFGNDKLSDLDYDLDVDYDDATVTNAQDDLTDLDVRFPLISSNRIWEYGDASPADISTVSGKINYTELFPAVKDKVILEAIEAKYGITLTGLFLNTTRFTNRFTLWKNRKEPNFTNAPIQVQFAAGGTKPLKDNIFYLQWIDPVTYAAAGYSYAWTTKMLRFFLTPSLTGQYFIDIYNNGNYNNSLTVNGTAGVQQTLLVINPVPATDGTPNIDREYTYFIRSTTAVNVTGSLQLVINGYYVSGGVQTMVPISETVLPITDVITTNNIDFKNSAPDVKVADYFSGLLNQFNLTCFPTSADLTFQLEPVPKWYAIGKDYDVSEFIDVESIKFDRIKLYKNISFEYQECKSFMNVAFKESFNREYGNLNEQFDFDGGEFKIKLPFENLLFNRFTNTDLQVGYSMTDPVENADKSYIPKCTGLYKEELPIACDFYLGTQHITSYIPFGQDTTVANSMDYSLNFGSEQSSLKGEIIDNSLFYVYYYPYLTSLFNPKARRVTCNGRFPLWLINEVTLNSKLIIRDKKYLIEMIKTNLTTGDVDLTLIPDLMPREILDLSPVVPSGGGSFTMMVTIPYDNQDQPTSYVTIDTPAETQFVTTSPVLPTNITTSTNFEFTIPVNATGSERINTIPVVYYNMDGTEQFTQYMVITQEPDITYLTGGGVQLLTNGLNELTT